MWHLSCSVSAGNCVSLFFILCFKFKKNCCTPYDSNVQWYTLYKRYEIFTSTNGEAEHILAHLSGIAKKKFKCFFYTGQVQKLRAAYIICFRRKSAITEEAKRVEILLKDGFLRHLVVGGHISVMQNIKSHVTPARWGVTFQERERQKHSLMELANEVL